MIRPSRHDQGARFEAVEVIANAAVIVLGLLASVWFCLHYLQGVN